MRAFLEEGATATGVVKIFVTAGRYQLALVGRGEGSRLQGSRNDSAHLRFCPSNRRAACQSSEQTVRNFAICQSCRVFRLWQLRQSQRRLSGVNVRIIAAEPSALATSITSLWSISSYEPPYI